MNPTDPAITDPAQLAGFTLVAGERAAFLGDDADLVVILGHPPEETAREVAAALLQQFCSENDAREAAGQHGLDRVYARFTAWAPNGESDNWWCDYSHPDPGPDLIAVTIVPLD